jgi:hypothetical protein
MSPILIPEWMTSEEVEQALLLIADPWRPQVSLQSLEKLTLDDWSGLFLAYQFLQWARQLESVH